ncbi:FtsH protease activity modulator HflK [Buchnera aphidicola]|uniref:Protein HflK n=1 Tax=Buchnera aphidicola subsp. Melaphis rhois TaxID=118103 RepID=A0A4D6YBT4_BUCMH|nr:FtsH protease activity modulator HflK [Buchnera aphidicola]QCI23518.1 FtsH protease activity modulator HflK [Buchnera aphidicola (Melaphis rhois)]
MVWNQPSNNKPELDPWSKKNRNSENFKNKKNGFFTLLELKKFFYSLKLKIQSFYNNSGSYKCAQNPIILILITVVFTLAVNGFYTIKEAERGVITRFGKFSHLVGPGLNWRLVFVDHVVPINIKSVKELATSGVMLTSDENVVRVEMNVQYRITDPLNYLFSVTNPDDSLREATDSALRGVIGHSTMDRVLTEGRTIVRSDTQKEIEKTILPYNMGITVLDVNFQVARPPEEVKSAFDDAIAARENREQYIREAEAYVNEVQPKANGKAQRILEEARAYKFRIISHAKGEIARFLKILPAYKISKDITTERLYIESMEKIFSHVRKIFVNNNSLLFSIDNLFSKKNIPLTPYNYSIPRQESILNNLQVPVSKKQNSNSVISNKLHNNIVDQKKTRVLRVHFPRKGRE